MCICTLTCACTPHRQGVAPHQTIVEANAAVTTTAPAEHSSWLGQPPNISSNHHRPLDYHPQYKVDCSHNTHQPPDHPAALAPATTPHTHNAAHRSPPRSSASINHPTPAEPKQQPGARTRTRLTVHANRFREHRRKPAHTELRGNLWHPGELPRDRGMSQLGGIQVEHVSKR